MLSAKRNHDIEYDQNIIEIHRELIDGYSRMFERIGAERIDFDVIGPILVDAVYELCEAGLRVLWGLKSSDDGRLPWISIDKLISKGALDYPISHSAIVYGANMADSRKKLKDRRKRIDAGEFARFISCAVGFIEEICTEIRKAMGSDKYNIAYDASLRVLDSVRGLLEPMRRSCRELAFAKARRKRVVSNGPIDTGFNFILVENEDERSEDELDHIYRERSSNKRSSLLPVFILYVLKDETSWKKGMTPSQIHSLVNERYELDVDIKSVRRTLYTLAADELDVWADENQKTFWFSTERPDYF